jgi:hypothetical protein
MINTVMTKSIFNELFNEVTETEQTGFRRLDEFTVKDISKIINPTDLPHRDYEPLLKQVTFQGVNKNIAKFLVMNNLNGWDTFIQFMDWNEQLQDTSLKASEVANLLMWSGDVRMYCGCPSFKYFGYQYILTQLGASIVPENRFPHVRNPQLLGIACKHIRRLMRVLPFHRGNLAAAIKRQRDQLGIRYIPKSRES